MLKLCGHSDTIQHKVWFHSLHEGGETDVGVGLVPHGHQDGAGQVGHTLIDIYGSWKENELVGFIVF